MACTHFKRARETARGLRTRLSRLSRLWRDENGTTAIEFAIVSAPFMLLAFGIIGIGLQFFTINALEKGVADAARTIRVGKAQTGTILSTQTEPTTLADFKTLVCEKSGSYISCDSKLVIHVQSAAEWADLTPINCVTGGELTPRVGNDSDSLTTSSGGASQVVLVTACYEWDLGGSMWQRFWNILAGGSWSNGDTAATANKTILSGVATFRTEPYE